MIAQRVLPEDVKFNRIKLLDWLADADDPDRRGRFNGFRRIPIGGRKMRTVAFLIEPGTGRRFFVPLGRLVFSEART